MEPIHAFGNEATQQNYLLKLSSGQFMSCLGLTEPDHRSDPGSMSTRAHKAAGGYSLTGHKVWITNSPIADVFVACTRDDEGAIRGFVLEKGWKGLRWPAVHRKVGLHASITSEIVMDQVFCPGKTPFPTSAAEGCFERARRYALDCKHFGKSLAANQLTQKKLADTMTRISLGLQGCLRLGRVQRNNWGRALKIARTTRGTLGGNGNGNGNGNGGEVGVTRHLVNQK